LIFKSNVWEQEWQELQELYQILDLNLDMEDILLCDDVDPFLEVCWWKEGF
jgi:hypothetical protein